MHSEADVDGFIKDHTVMVFSKSWCPFCKKVKDLFSSLAISYNALELDELGENGEIIQKILLEKTGQKTVPNVFIRGQHIGGCDKTLHLHTDGVLLDLVSGKLSRYDYDLIVIGGGSGGLAAAKEAGKLGKKVLLCDFVVPSPVGTVWGLGGTCVNVGCIPKKLMHKASLIGEDLEDSLKFGWSYENIQHNWSSMVSEIQMYIKSLNWQYKKELKDKNVTYKNAYVKFVDAHNVELVDKKGSIENISADTFIISVGTRPKYPLHISNSLKLGITSDDLFSLPECPGKTLLIGASYISLECAGFLNGLGVSCTVLVRSICLRGFDQQMARIATSYMKEKGVKFLEGCILVNIAEGPDKKKQVFWKDSDESVSSDYFDTVIYAMGREARISDMNLEGVGINIHKMGKIIVDEKEQTSVNNIYAIGDIIYGKPELTPVAIQAGKLLIQRLYNGSSELMDYVNVPTTVFTPLEYGCVGYSEEDAISKFEEKNLEVYHTTFNPLEFSLSKRANNIPYAKLICLKTEDEKVIGLHIVGPNAGEIVQGFAIALKLGAKKSDFDKLVGIHPTCAEKIMRGKARKENQTERGKDFSRFSLHCSAGYTAAVSMITKDAKIRGKGTAITQVLHKVFTTLQIKKSSGESVGTSGC